MISKAVYVIWLRVISIRVGTSTRPAVAQHPTARNTFHVNSRIQVLLTKPAMGMSLDRLSFNRLAHALILNFCFSQQFPVQFSHQHWVAQLHKIYRRCHANAPISKPNTVVFVRNRLFMTKQRFAFNLTDVLEFRMINVLSDQEHLHMKRATLGRCSSNNCCYYERLVKQSQLQCSMILVL